MTYATNLSAILLTYHESGNDQHTGSAEVLVADPSSLKSAGTWFLRSWFLNKAAIILDGDVKADGSKANPWTLCSVQQIEEVKYVVDCRTVLQDLGSAPSGAIVLLHACAHNPTGVDPTPAQWEQIRQLIRSKGLLPFFDSAYQGFASGSLDRDAEPVRMFVADGGECLVAQSYAKNLGLYGERVGALSIVSHV
ncbi:hypothetical protein POM88_050624 [Heracleum sosnowskyi]|uniref:Aspartate aminotransferase n=1 Tax=Heracleum sosnowskyi TaxID=360622 RepID=A0AAD8GZ75_9APIA|nr:hypothetical protein POM88_050624 [Heracleum sosnowskyi]